MIEFYTEIRLVHIVTVLASGGLFFLRGIGLFAGRAWPKIAPVRYLSYSIDTLLLVAALLLAMIIGQYPFAQAWLTAKVLLLVAYIALGILAFRAGRPLKVRLACWLLALATFAFIISIARTRSPLGVFSTFVG